MKKINIIIEGISGKDWSNSCELGLRDTEEKLILDFLNLEEIEDDTFFLYPVTLGNYFTYLGIGDDTFDEKKSFLYLMNLRIKTLIQNKNGYILINRFAEGHVTHQNYKDLHNELIKYDIPGNKVMLVSSNMNGKKQYKTFCKNMQNLTKTKITVIEAAHRLESAVNTYNQIIDDNFNKELYNKVWPYKNSFFTKKEMKDMKDTLREKYFLSYNRIIREYRLALVAMLYELGVQDKGIISLGAPKVNKEYGGVWPTHIGDFIEDKKQNEVVSNAVANIKSLYPINADKDIIPEFQYTEEGERIGGAVGDYTHFSHQYKRIYFNIVTESCYYEDCIYFSEKTFRPISQLTPFLFVGTPFSLAKLREVGFKTFSPYIDESYDEETDNDKRFFMILDEVKRLCNMTKKEIHKWYYEMEDILIYNQDHFANYKLQDHKNVWNEISEIMYG
jgi:hypothetical protein